MRPPICEVCRRPAAATVRFADYRALPEGVVGHPRGLGWFCRWHLPGARALERRTLGGAVRRLRGASLAVLLAAAAVLALTAWALWV